MSRNEPAHPYARENADLNAFNQHLPKTPIFLAKNT
jgi:hypothetical protein